MSLVRNIGYMEGSGDPNADVTIQAGGGNLPTLYVDISADPVQLYEYYAGVSVPNKWQKIGFDKLLPWVKTGHTSEDGTSSVNSDDDIFRVGKTNMGANEDDMPFETQFRQKFYENSAVMGKLFVDNYSLNNTTTVSISINPITGNDSLDITDYPNSTFKTLDKAFEWIEKCTALSYTLFLNGTSSSTKAQLNNTRNLTNKRILIYGGHIEFNALLNMYESTIEFTSSICYFNVSQSIVCNHGTIFFNQGVCNIGTFGQGCINCKNNSRISMRGGMTWNFSANGQYILFDSATSVYDLELFTTSSYYPIIFNPGVFTNCSIGKISPSITRYPYRIWISGGGSTLIMFNGCHLGQTFTLRGNDGMSIQGWADTDYTKGYVAHGTKAFHSPNLQAYADNELAIAGSCIVGEFYINEQGFIKMVKPTGTVNDKISWTTTNRPSSPYLGQDGFNITDLCREYWNGTSWIQY